MSNIQKNNKPNVPNLRFPEFSGEWMSCQLGKIASLSKGEGISKRPAVNKWESLYSIWRTLYDLFYRDN